MDLPTVRAGHAVASKKLCVGQTWHGIKKVDGGRTRQRNDRVNVEHGLTSQTRIEAATERGRDVAHGPAHAVSGVMASGLLRADPRLGHALDVELQDLHDVVDGESGANKRTTDVMQVLVPPESSEISTVGL